MTNKVSKYEEQADRLAKAVDIAEQIIKESANFNAELANPMLEFGTQIKHMALNPEPQFKKMVSLKYLESDFFTFWNESTRPDIDKFWNRVFESKLGYIRKDAIQDVLKFHTGFAGDNGIEEIEEEILKINHRTIGEVSEIDTEGLTYRIKLISGQEIRVEAEETPGKVENDYPLFDDDNWKFEVTIKRLKQ